MIKNEVLKANLDLPKYKLVTFTWGNVSGRVEDEDYFYIKPSGIEYENLILDDLVAVKLDGSIVEGHRKPSSDTATHLEIYKAFPGVGAVVHTHSNWATSWAQAGMGIPALGTTHADYFHGEIPCTRGLSAEEVKGSYELNTGSVIIETFRKSGIDFQAMPAVLVRNHGPFTWGSTPAEALHNAVVLEEVAKMAWRSLMLDNRINAIPDYLLDKHFLRKHGSDAYYGQK